MDSKSCEALPRMVSMHSHWIPFQSPFETADPTTSNPLCNVSLSEGGYRVAGLKVNSTLRLQSSFSPLFSDLSRAGLHQ